MALVVRLRGCGFEDFTSFILHVFVAILPSLVVMLPRVAMIGPCCGADYQGQYHRRRDAINGQGYVWIGRKRLLGTVLYLNHCR
jgi:hypothetical protein